MCFILIGVCLALYTPSNITHSKKYIITENVVSYSESNNTFWNTFAHVYFNNVLVGVLLSVIGFLTAGALTAIVLVSNGFYMTLIILESYLSGMGFTEIFHAIAFHGFFELASFLWLGVIGFGGYEAYKKVIFNDVKISKYLFNYKQLVLANMLLFFAALVESLYGILINAY